MSDGNGHLRPAQRPLRVALLAPPLLPVPPARYGGTERVVWLLAEELHRRGHAVTVFASGDSRLSCRLVPTVAKALWTGGQSAAAGQHMQLVAATAMRHEHEFDLIHAHLEWHGFVFARRARVPVVTTLLVGPSSRRPWRQQLAGDDPQRGAGTSGDVARRRRLPLLRRPAGAREGRGRGDRAGSPGGPAATAGGQGVRATGARGLREPRRAGRA